MKLIVPVFLCLLPIAGMSQANAKFVIELQPDSETKKIPVPFADIKVMDARFDQSNVGCVALQAEFMAITQYKEQAVFPDSLKNYLPQYCSRILQWDKTSSDTLVMLVKQFRITDHLFNTINGVLEPSSVLNLSISFYGLRNQKYYRLFAIDQVLKHNWSPTSKALTKKTIPFYREAALRIILNQIFQNRSWQFHSSYFTAAEVWEGLAKRFQLPVLQDASRKTGLYKNFAEFKNNQPSITDIRPEYREGKLIGARDIKGRLLDLNPYWGLCDGNKNYIVFRDEPFELLPVDKSFRFISYIYSQELYKKPDFATSASRYGLVPAILSSGDKRALSYFYLNMDNGEIYMEELFGDSGLKHMQNEFFK
jgi:hypothetical protein